MKIIHVLNDGIEITSIENKTICFDNNVELYSDLNKLLRPNINDIPKLYVVSRGVRSFRG